MFSISEFNASLDKHGLARDNLFVMRITPPNILTRVFPASELQFFCNSVSIPGLTLTSTTLQRHGYGKQSTTPTGLPMDSFNSVFMVDSNFKVKEFFHRWVQSIVNYDNSDSNGQYNSMLPYEIAYEDDYAGVIDVDVFSITEKDMKYSYKFSRAYPSAIGDITTAWENNDAIMTLPVQFSFDQFRNTGMAQHTKSIRDEIPGNALLSKVTENLPIQDVVNRLTTVSGFNNGLSSVSKSGSSLTSLSKG